MNQKTCKISPNKEVCVILAGGLLASLLLILWGYVGNLSRQNSPWFLLGICVIALLLELKTTWFSPEGLLIHYHLLGWKRRIPYGQIRSIEYASSQGSYYFLVAIKDCRLLRETRQTYGYYALLHLRKVISIRIPGGKREEYKAAFQEIFPEMLWE